jgi:predicted nucleotidyltransferase
MRPSEAVTRHRGALLDAARRHGVLNVRIFGSAARGEDRDGSDLDLLIDVPRGTTYFMLARLKREIETLTGIACDLHTPSGLKDSIREPILKDAVPL